jgi:hypothetical protein
MSYRVLLGFVILLLRLASTAQNVAPTPAPDTVTLQLTTEDQRHQYYLGELIKLRFVYSGLLANRDLWVDMNPQFVRAGGGAIQIKCDPPPPLRVQTGSLKHLRNFESMVLGSCSDAKLNLRIQSGGVLSGIVSYPIQDSVPFGPVPVTDYVRLSSPGKYTCHATSIQLTSRGQENVHFLLKSNSLELTIVDDPEWSRKAALNYGEAFEKSCLGERNTRRNSDSSRNCAEIVSRITTLDTPESLELETKYWDGRSDAWDVAFVNAISATNHPREALQLMTRRIQDPDVRVHAYELVQLAMASLDLETSGALESSEPAQYHSQAVDKLREYVRLFGSSLASKHPDVVDFDLAAYRDLAEGKDCSGATLIPGEERDRVISAARTDAP